MNCQTIRVAGRRSSSLLWSLWMSLLPMLAVANPAMHVSRVGHWAEGPAEAVTVAGSLAYCGVGGLLRIADVTTPANPVILGETIIPSLVLGIEVSGDYAYVAGAYTGLHVVDVSDPAAPVEVGALDTGLRA